VLVATVILAIAAVTVASRQKAKVNAAGEAARISQVAKKANYVTVKVAGQDVQVDGQTGKMKALTPEEAQKLAAGLGKVINQSAEGLVQVQHPDGSVSMDLEGRFQNVAVARVNEDGTVSQSCVDNPEAAGEFFGIEPKLIDEKSKTTRTENHANRTVVKTQR
jgi:RNase P/RNase MRP subunit p29